LSDILEISFNLAYFFHTSPFDFDTVDFFEFVWQYERLAKEKENEHKQPSNNSVENLFGGMSK
jgi:hypothetical protein